jgi:hypothetical protein
MESHIAGSEPGAVSDSIVNSVRLPGWVISFDASALERLRFPLKQLGFDLFHLEAVHGGSLGLDAYAQLDIDGITLRTGRAPSPGMLGCALSHRGVYRALLESGQGWGLVLEDDALPTTDATLGPEGVQALLGSMPPGPVVLQLYTRGARFVGRKSRYQAVAGRWLFRFKFPPGQTAAYLINREAAALLLSRPIDGPADWPNASAKVSFFGIFPWLFTESGRPSTIEMPMSLPYSWRLNQILGINALRAKKDGVPFSDNWRVSLGPYLASILARRWGGTAPLGSKGPHIAFSLRRRRDWPKYGRSA